MYLITYSKYNEFPGMKLSKPGIYHLSPSVKETYDTFECAKDRLFKIFLCNDVVVYLFDGYGLDLITHFYDRLYYTNIYNLDSMINFLKQFVKCVEGENEEDIIRNKLNSINFFLSEDEKELTYFINTFYHKNIMIIHITDLNDLITPIKSANKN